MAEPVSGNEHIVTWNEVHRDTKALVNRLIDAGPWRGIVAISRGGLVPATILAREMEIRYVDTLCIASYDEKDQSEITLIKSPDEAVADAGKGWLLVDDLVDTGTTMRAAMAFDDLFDDYCLSAGFVSHDLSSRPNLWPFSEYNRHAYPIAGRFWVISSTSANDGRTVLLSDLRASSTEICGA